MARISIFKGREARLNKAILWILAFQGPLNAYKIWRKVRKEKGNFAYIHYHVVNRRVRALKEQGYIEKYGEERAEKIPMMVSVYQLTSRAYLAILLDKIDLDDFIEGAGGQHNHHAHGFGIQQTALFLTVKACGLSEESMGQSSIYFLISQVLPKYSSFMIQIYSLVNL